MNGITQEMINAGFKYDPSDSRTLKQQITDFCDNYALDHCEDGCRVDDIEETDFDWNREE